METIGVGVVGCGFVGRGAHVPAFDDIEGAHLVAVADPDARRRGKATKKYKVKSSYDDSADLVKDPDVDLVVVAVPTPLHAKVALEAIEAGKHVLCEMPLAPSLEEADELIEAAKRQGVCLMPGLTFRFTPTFVKVKQLISQGAIGQPTAVVYREVIPAKDLAQQWPPGSWMWQVDESGGPLFTLSVWSIDLVRWLLDTEVKEVHAVTNYTPLEKLGGTLGYDSSATIQLESGVVASLQYSGTVAPSAASNWLEVIGDSTGVLKASGYESVTLYDDDPAKTEWNVTQPGAGMWGHRQQDEYFIRCIQEGKVPDVTAEDGRRAMEIALEMTRRPSH